MVEERAFFTRLYPWDNCFYSAQNKPEKKVKHTIRRIYVFTREYALIEKLLQNF